MYDIEREIKKCKKDILFFKFRKFRSKKSQKMCVE